MYSQFVSYLGFCSTKENQIHTIATLHVAFPILWIPCLLMPWRLEEPEHHQHGMDQRSRNIQSLASEDLISVSQIFLLLQKYPLDQLNHIHIWQVPPQLCCSGTCQIWRWYSKGKQNNASISVWKRCRTVAQKWEKVSWADHFSSIRLLVTYIIWHVLFLFFLVKLCSCTVMSIKVLNLKSWIYQWLGPTIDLSWADEISRRILNTGFYDSEKISVWSK